LKLGKKKSGWSRKKKNGADPRGWPTNLEDKKHQREKREEIVKHQENVSLA